MSSLLPLFTPPLRGRDRASRAQVVKLAVVPSVLLIAIAGILLTWELRWRHKTLQASNNKFLGAQVPILESRIESLALPTPLDNWCVPEDKAASGWTNLTDEECMQRSLQSRASEVAKVRNGTGLLFFKHVHKAGGTTLCHLAQQNMEAEDTPLPFRTDWTTNCVPYEAFLGPHPAVGGSGTADVAMQRHFQRNQPHRYRRRLSAAWLGGACFVGFLTPAQLRVMHSHYRPLTFVASEGPLPDALPLDPAFAMVTMLRDPLDRALSSYKWWQFMVGAMPQSPTECRAYWVPPNATLEQWLTLYPDNWMTRELAGREALYRRGPRGLPGPLKAEDVEVAKQRLHAFAAVMILERWEDSMKLMRGMFGWKDLDFGAHRAGSMKNTSAAVELREQPEVMRKLRSRNVYDMEIYRYALMLHERQVQELGKEPLG